MTFNNFSIEIFYRISSGLLGLNLIVQAIEFLWLLKFSYKLPAWIIFLRPKTKFGNIKIWLLGESIKLALGMMLLTGYYFIKKELIFLGLLGCVFYSHLRTFGRFNGGSDSMTWICLSGPIVFWVMGGIFTGVSHEEFYLVWLAVFSLTSYFIAGVVKVSSRQWWTGDFFIQLPKLEPIYGSSLVKVGEFFKDRKFLRIILGLTIIAFEILAPFALISSWFALAFVFVVAGFHLAVFWIFGLNRFFWAWAPTFPAIIFLSYRL